MTSDQTYFVKAFDNKLETKIYIVPIFKDNYVYILTDHSKKAFIIDPGMAEPVLNVVKLLNLEPTHLLITHSHHDHIGGVPGVMSAFPKLRKIDFSDCMEESQNFIFNGRPFEIFKTPGHWPDHICFLETQERILFCGDILFRFGCGRIFDGSFQELFQSLQKLKKLPPDTRVFCTHEYTKQNLAFCVENDLVDTNLFSEDEKQGVSMIPSLPVKLSVELKYNPFLRAQSLSELTSLRILRNNF